MERTRKTIYRVVKRDHATSLEVQTLCLSHASAIDVVHERMADQDLWRVGVHAHGGSVWLRHDGSEAIYMFPESAVV